MIIDRLKNSHIYYSISDRIKTALDFLKSSDFDVLKPGKYEINGFEVMAICEEYITKPRENVVWEAHRKFIDIQFIVKGAEFIGYSDIEDMKVTKQYDHQKDSLNLDGNGNFLLLRPGTFMILMPHDVHAPGFCVSEPEYVKKIVMKVLI
ncbi:MAG: DUF386 domain-containing protein [Clostridiaceae bacterium]|nr:DUF386 domain-containing protein [Clostridiaceae bacterium]